MASMVVIADAPMLSIDVMQERVAVPSICTVHAPHSAMPHPNFVPVMPSTSRSTHKSGVSPSTSTLCVVPLTLMVKAIRPPEQVGSEWVSRGKFAGWSRPASTWDAPARGATPGFKRFPSPSHMSYLPPFRTYRTERTAMHSVGFVTFPNFGAMGLAALSTFEHANFIKGEGVYEVKLLSESGGLVRSSAGFLVMTEPFGDAELDTLIVGAPTRLDEPAPGVIAFIRQSMNTARRIAAT